jgi:hypothetical protein
LCTTGTFGGASADLANKTSRGRRCPGDAPFCRDRAGDVTLNVVTQMTMQAGNPTRPDAEEVR